MLNDKDLGLIANGLVIAHYEENEKMFKEFSEQLAKYYYENEKPQRAEYILAQISDENVFMPQWINEKQMIIDAIKDLKKMMRDEYGTDIPKYNAYKNVIRKLKNALDYMRGRE